MRGRGDARTRRKRLQTLKKLGKTSIKKKIIISGGFYPLVFLL
jgi:histone acetyltransferase (RNA polymerase elongator complex component)